MKNAFFILITLISQITLSQQLDIQGHRGCRGLLPENTIPAFIKALDLGVTTIELDVVISKDGKVVVSHEPFLNPTICLDTAGNKILSNDAFNLYQMNYEEIALCDCGSLENPRFEGQEKISVSKPLLSEVIKAVEWYIKSYTQFEVDYDIEIKSTPAGDNKFHPSPQIFSDLVFSEIDKYLPWERVIIQSFDFRVLKYWHKNHPEIKLAALIENNKSIATNLANLGFQPEIYSCNYELLNEEKVRHLHSIGTKVVPWTVNTTEQMEQLVAWGVDGLITDYPNLAVDLGYISIKREED